MNIPFRLRDDALDEEFLKQAKARGLTAAQGSSLGGRHARFDLQRHACGRSQGAGPIHARVRSPAWLSRLRILTLNSISAVGLKRLPAERYSVGTHVQSPDAILVRSQDMHAMDIAQSVKAIGRAGAGTNNIPVATMNERGVPVFNAPGRQCQCGQGTGTCRHADGGAQSRSRDSLRRCAFRCR